MTTKNVLAIDFGTANTYYCKCPGDQLSPKGVDFGYGRDGLATAILYREGKTPLVGDAAMQVYGEATQQERKGYTLRTHFKPDISASEEARKNARDFLAGVLEEAKNQRIDLDPANREVIFGVPSEASENFRKALSQVARDAGYGDIRMVDEPKGALLYHVYHKDISPKDALKGIMVIDFGGGTCDFAFMRRGNVLRSWGDMQLGGRLFDDLFFQWFIDENPGALDKLRKDDIEYFVHSRICREMKEFFSQTMARDRNEYFFKAVRHYGKLTDITWEKFIQRATSYRPSLTFKHFWANASRPSNRFDEPDTGIDLLNQFRNCLQNGIHDGKIDKSDVGLVILAGGSSQWPFVVDIVCDELGVEESKIMRSDRPYVTISEGLAILPARQRESRGTQDKLRAELPDFCEHKLRELIEKRVKCVAKDVASSVTRELFDEKIKPLFEEFRSRGGSIASLKTKVSSIALGFEPRLSDLLKDKQSIYDKAIVSELKDLVSKWFDSHALAVSDEILSVEQVDTLKSGELGVDVPDYSSVINSIALFTGGFITSIVAIICGGGGMAIIMSGPIGWIIGLILGIVISYLTLRYGAQKAKQMVEDWNIPRWMLKRVLNDKNISKTREKFVNEIASKVEGNLIKVQPALTEKVKTWVEREIEALNEFNQL